MSAAPLEFAPILWEGCESVNSCHWRTNLFHPGKGALQTKRARFFKGHRGITQEYWWQISAQLDWFDGGVVLLAGAGLWPSFGVQ